MNCRNCDSRRRESRAQHSQTIKTLQPRRLSALRLALPRSTFASRLGSQYRRLLATITRPRLQLCRCQKQPCTNTAVRCIGSTISGQPGRSARCRRKRYPSRCRHCRTSNSGVVSFDRIRDMQCDRCCLVRLSTVLPLKGATVARTPLGRPSRWPARDDKPPDCVGCAAAPQARFGSMRAVVAVARGITDDPGLFRHGL